MATTGRMHWKNSLGLIASKGLSAETRQIVSLAVPVCLASVYAAIVMWNGPPTLRHDWGWPTTVAQFVDIFMRSGSGWNSDGMGQPAPYPVNYILGALIGLSGMATGSQITLALFAFAIGAACSFGVRAMTQSLGSGTCLGAVLQLFALFNPWVYNETAAGHLAMILAYGGIYLLIAEFCRKEPRPAVLSLLLLLELPQLQFFVIASLVAAAYSIIRKSWLPVISAMMLGLPAWIGIVLNRDTLIQTPYTLAWQTSQSVPLKHAIALQGYFAGYSDHYTIIQRAGVVAILSFAAISPFFVPKRRLAVALILAGTVSLLFAAGTEGPLAPLYTALVTRFAPSGLYRELYDVLAFTLAAAVFAIASVQRFAARRFVWSLLALSVISASAWVSYPPYRYWVNGYRIPLINVNAAANSRYALYPAFQPISLEKNGSGQDPDAFRRRRNVTPINEYISRYPENVALATYNANGSVEDLSALSVSEVIRRPWFESDYKALTQQLSGVPRAKSVQTAAYHHIASLPELSVGPVPAVAGLANHLGAGNIFFGDAALAHGDAVPSAWALYPKVRAVKAPNIFVNARDGWVSSSFAFVSSPTLGQGIGGAITTNKKAWLDIPSGNALLVNVVGSLWNSKGQLLSKNTGGYRWIRLPFPLQSVRCSGRCVVVAESDNRVPVPMNPAARPFTALAMRQVFPWIAIASVAETSFASIRYNVSYDRYWMAILNGHVLTHIRLDATVNGWLIPKGRHHGTLLLINAAAFVQAISEACGYVWAAILMVLALSGGRNRAVLKKPVCDRAVVC